MSSTNSLSGSESRSSSQKKKGLLSLSSTPIRARSFGENPESSCSPTRSIPLPRLASSCMKSKASAPKKPLLSVRKWKKSTDSNSSVSSGSDDVSSLYDAYLVSQLLKVKSQEKLEAVKKHAKQEVTDMWNSLENIRSTVEQKKAWLAEIESEKAKILAYKEYLSVIDDNFLPVLESVSEKVYFLRHALETGNHRLSVKGINVLDGPNQSCEELLTKFFEGLTEIERDFKAQDLSAFSRGTEECEENLNSMMDIYENFKRNAELASELTNRLSSLKLSESLNEKDYENVESSLLSIDIPPPLNEEKFIKI